MITTTIKKSGALVVGISKGRFDDPGGSGEQYDIMYETPEIRVGKGHIFDCRNEMINMYRGQMR